MYALLQTMLWVGFWTCVIVWYRKAINGLLHALTQRIQSGSGLSAFGFDLAAQTPEEQKSKVEGEATEIIEQERVNSEAEETSTDPSDAPAYEPPKPTRAPSVIRTVSEILQVDDLALRKVQAEFGAPIQRQVSFQGSNFDGVFQLGDFINVVEVRYIRAIPNTSALVGSMLNFIAKAGVLKWAQPIIVVYIFVVRHPSFLSADQREKLVRQAQLMRTKVDIRFWDYAELATEFGVSPFGKALPKTDDN